MYPPDQRPALSRDQTNSHGCGAQHACTMGHSLIVTNSYLNTGHYIQSIVYRILNSKYSKHIQNVHHYQPAFLDHGTFQPAQYRGHI